MINQSLIDINSFYISKDVISSEHHSRYTSNSVPGCLRARYCAIYYVYYEFIFVIVGINILI